MKCDKKVMRLYAVTDRAWAGSQTLPEQVAAALRGGVTCVQLREKDLQTDAFLTEALEIKALCRQFKVPFIVNDSVEVALQSGADGIHVGQGDMDAARVRAVAGRDMILGVSVQTVEQALLAQQSGADYLGVGAVFATSTKPEAETVSRREMQAICRAVSIPVVAIGGIDAGNLPQLSGIGLDGVALVSAIFGGGDIEAECRRLLALSETMVNQ